MTKQIELKKQTKFLLVSRRSYLSKRLVLALSNTSISINAYLTEYTIMQGNFAAIISQRKSGYLMAKQFYMPVQTISETR